MTNRLDQLPEDLQRNIYEQRIATLNQQVENDHQGMRHRIKLIRKQRALVKLLKKDFKRWAGFEWHANLPSDTKNAKLINHRDLPEPTNEDGSIVDPYPQETIELINKVYPDLSPPTLKRRYAFKHMAEIRQRRYDSELAEERQYRKGLEEQVKQLRRALGRNNSHDLPPGLMLKNKTNVKF